MFRQKNRPESDYVCNHQLFPDFSQVANPVKRLTISRELGRVAIPVDNVIISPELGRVAIPAIFKPCPWNGVKLENQ
jgi:hypothetical protein